MLSFGCDFIDIEVLWYEFFDIVKFVSTGAKSLCLGFDEGVATSVAGVDDCRTVIVHANVVKNLVTLGAAQLPTEVVGVLGCDVGATEVVDDFFCLHG